MFEVLKTDDGTYLYYKLRRAKNLKTRNKERTKERKPCSVLLCLFIYSNPASILYKSTAGRYRPVRVADGPIAVRCRFIKNGSRECSLRGCITPTPQSTGLSGIQYSK